MIDSDWLGGMSVVVGDQRARGRGPQLPVEPDGCSQGQQPLSDPDLNPGRGAAAVLLQAQLALEGVDDALDPLANRPQTPETGWLIAAVGPHQQRPKVGHMPVHLGAGQSLVHDEDLPGSQAAAVQQGLGDLAFAELGAGQAPGDRAAISGADQIQLEAPVPARVAGTPAVVRPPAQRRALDRLAAGGTGDRGGVQQPERVLDAGGLTHQVGQDFTQQPAGLAQPLVVAGLVRQIREQVPQPAVAQPDPAVLTMAAQQDLGDRQADEFGIRQPGLAARIPAAGVGTQQLIDDAVQCDDEVVEGGVHEASLEVDVAMATPTLGGLVLVVTTRHPHSDSESII